MNKKEKLIVGLGELLWDLLPDGKQLGGAPSNFAVMSARLGNHAVIASRVGQDELGDAARAYLASLPVDASYVQIDTEHETGSVSVSLKEGQAEYVIHQPVAWDFLDFTPVWEDLARRADAVCFGTLAQRQAESRETIHRFLAATSPECVRVFDVNLRKPFYDADVLRESFARATVAKLNDAELPLVLSLLGVTHSQARDEAALLAGARVLLQHYPLALVCITMGAEGSLLVTSEAFHRHKGVPAQIQDTVGAGDAFTAALTASYLQGASLPVLNEAGNQWGSWIASQPGAMPGLSPDVRAQIEAYIQLIAMS